MGPLASWLPLLLVALGGFRWARALQEPTDSFTARVGDVRGFAVAAPWVYVDTGDHLHQLDLSLVSLRSLHQRGTYVAVPGSFDRTLAGLHAFGVKIMAPIVDRNVLITCGAVVCGYCELLDLRNITRIIHREFMEDASVGFLVDINNKSYLLTAAEISDTGVCPDKPTDPRIRLYGTNVGTPELFSFSDKTSSPEISARHRDVQFVNGFQIEKTIFIFSNVKVKTDLIKVRLIWLWAKEPKSKTLQSLRGATLDCSEGGEARQRLVSSSVIPGVQPVLWTGIFSEHGTTNTKLAIFDISPPPTNEQTYNDPDFSTSTVNENREPSTLKPKRVLLKQRFMTSVLAVKLNKWLIVFVGTGDGQLLKLIVDNNLQAHCLTVIWKAVDEHPVFPEMHLDPVGRKHVLVAVKNQLTRVPVSQCGQHSSSLGTCWSAHDPYCGWCDSRKRCSFEDECPASLWLSVPDDLSQRRMLSHSFQEDKDGKIKLVVRTHLTTGESGPPANFSCRFVSSVGELEGLQHQYPQCTCLLPPVIGLRVNVIVSLEGVVVTEELKLVNCTGIIGAPTSLLCSQCLAAGCGWSHDACTWTHMGTLNMTVCQALRSEVDSLVGLVLLEAYRCVILGRMMTCDTCGFSYQPEIFNIIPSALSLYGKNNVLLTGRNLDHVTRVRIQGDMDCSPKEASVWSNTGHSLMLHIPAGDKGRVQVCLLMHDGRCHGNASLTYHSVPICTSIVPNSSWASGKRKMEITVSSNVEFVEEVTHSHTDQKVAFSKSSGVTLRYESLAVGQSQGSFSSSVTLRVANHTLACPTAIHYLPDPKFTTFTSTRTTKQQLLLTIQKRADELQMAPGDLQVQVIQEDKELPCTMEREGQSNSTDFITCTIGTSSDAKITTVKIMYGDKINVLKSPKDYVWRLLLLIPIVIVVVVCIYIYKKNRLTAQMNTSMEDLELDIRNDIHQGELEQVKRDG
ncbi:Plexin-C1 [Merluccius polli]|uniref:Plexin-C1 n=1 Tax=Merluccius polli TaxID=89951 RepID=A0AA47PBR6_MERPO|nr:Plexin-C1 [Merluccius polli]